MYQKYPEKKVVCPNSENLGLFAIFKRQPKYFTRYTNVSRYTNVRKRYTQSRLWHLMMLAIQRNTTISKLESMYSKWGTAKIYNDFLPFNKIIGSVLRSDESVREARMEIVQNALIDKEIFGNFSSEIPKNSETIKTSGTTKNSKSSETLKLLTVRHPLARLQSCHRDKFTIWENTTENYRVHNAHIRAYRSGTRWTDYWKAVSKYETVGSLKTKSKFEMVSFQAFLKFLTDGNHMKNPHWKPVYKTCSTCLIDFNYISKLETVRSDSKEIMDILNVQTIGGFPEAYSGAETRGKKNTGEITEKNSDGDDLEYVKKLRKFYAKIPENTLLKIEEIYHWDFELFNYHLL